MEVCFWYLKFFLMLLCLVFLITGYFKQREIFSLLSYILLSILILFGLNTVDKNLLYLVFTFLEFKDTSYMQAIQLNQPQEFNNFCKQAEKNIKPSETFSVLTPGASSNYLKESKVGVKANYDKFKLVYYLTPRKLVNEVNNADYVIVINYFKTPVKIDVGSKYLYVNNYSGPYSLVKL